LKFTKEERDDIWGQKLNVYSRVLHRNVILSVKSVNIQIKSLLINVCGNVNYRYLKRKLSDRSVKYSVGTLKIPVRYLRRMFVMNSEDGR
jgi:hypothetical protein